MGFLLFLRKPFFDEYSIHMGVTTKEEIEKKSIPEIKQVLLSYIGDSLDLMLNETGKQDRVVHAVRVNMKKSRAALRLIRSFLGDDVYRRENASFRDTSRLLAELRESRVHLKTLEKLNRRYQKLVRAQLMKDTRKVLASHRGKVVATDMHTADVWEEVIDRLWKAKFRINFIKMDAVSPADFCAGFQKNFMRALDFHLASLRDPGMHNIHEFRKFSKYLWYQLPFFEHLAPDYVALMEKDLKELTDRLGNEHDLRVLEDFLLENRAKLGKKRRMDQLIRVIRKEQNRQLKKCWPLSREVYHQRPTILEIVQDRYGCTT